MTTDLYERVQRKLFGGHTRNAFDRLRNDRAGISGPVQGSPEEFSLVLCELTLGELNRRNETVAYEFVSKGRKDLLKFRDGSLFRVVRTKGEAGGSLVVVTPHEPSLDDLLEAREMLLSTLVQDSLKIREAFAAVSLEYRAEERRVQGEQAAFERRIARESSLETTLSTIEQAKSGTTIMIRGLHNIDALVQLGFVPGLVDNPDNWIDAEDFPGMRYRQPRSGIEVLLTGREKFLPIEELNRLELYFLVNRSDDDPAAFGKMLRKFRENPPGGGPYGTQEFHADLIALVKYPEELKGRTEEDLGLMADEVEHVIDRRQELDRGILPYEAVFRRDTQAIIDAVRENGTPAGEIRKALDYFEYTGMIDREFKAALERQLAAAAAQAPEAQCAAADGSGDALYDKRVKEIVADVLKKIPKERLTSRTITIALAPYVVELGFSRLVKIRERILQLKQMVRGHELP